MEEEYNELFIPPAVMPDTLEQPSPLRIVPSMASDNAGESLGVYSSDTFLYTNTNKR